MNPDRAFDRSMLMEPSKSLPPPAGSPPMNVLPAWRNDRPVGGWAKNAAWAVKFPWS